MQIRDGHVKRFVLGFALICFAQFWIIQRDVVFLRYSFAGWLDQLFHIHSANWENTITAILFLCFGGVLVFRAVTFVSPASVSALTSTASPNLFRFLKQHFLSLLVAVLLFIWVLHQLGLADVSFGLVVLWICVIALFVRAAYYYDHESGAVLSPKVSRVDAAGIAIIFIAGLIIGAYQLEQIPNSLIGDEGSFLDRAQTISINNEERSFFDVGVYSYPLSSSFYQAPFIKVFGNSLWSWRFSSVFLAVLTVIPMYLLVREMFNHRVAVLSCILFITLPYLLAFERMGYNNAQSIFPVTLMVYLLYAGFRRQSLLYFCLGGVAAGIGFYTYTAGRLGLAVGFVFVIWVIVMEWLVRFRRRLPEARRLQAAQFTPKLVLFAAVFFIMSLVTLLPNVVHTSALSPDLLRYKLLESLFPNTNYAYVFYSADELFRDHPPIQVGDQEFFYRPDLYAAMLVRGVIRTALSMHDVAMTASHFIAAPLAGPLTVIFYFIGFVIALKYIYRREFFLLLLWFIGGMFLLSVINTFPARHQHFIPVVPVIAILIAVGFVTCLDLIAEGFHALFRRPLLQRFQPLNQSGALPLIITAVLLTFLVATNLRNYFIEMPSLYFSDLENIISWEAMALSEPEYFIYVYEDLERAEFKPMLINALPTNARYQTLYREDLLRNHFVLSPGQRYRFYFPFQNWRVIYEFKQTIADLDFEYEAYRDREQRIIGISISFDAPPRKH